MAQQGWLSTEAYKFVCQSVPIICIDCIIRTSLGILLTKRNIEPDYNTWHMPGGRIRLGEKIKDAVNRIVYDELGVYVANSHFITIMEITQEQQDDIYRHCISLVHLVTPSSYSFSVNWQATDISYFYKQPKNMSYNHAAFFNKYKIWELA